MLNLLIVDDESLTREGIANGIIWKEIGIECVMQADDGMSALEIASQNRPDIILTDIRMPCMNGIEMSKILRKQYPDCKIIFMSGYSDKEYLMSAIQLKAVSYIEKPIVREELKKVLEDTIKECLEEENKKLDQKITKKKIDISVSYIKNEIALRLLKGDKDEKLLLECMDLGMLDLKTDSRFVTVIIRLVREKYISESHFYEIKNSFSAEFEDYFNLRNIKTISAFKDNENMIIHSYCNFGGQLLSEKHLKDFFEALNDGIDNKKFLIAVGRPVIGIKNIKESYSTAVLAMQKTFFYGYGCIINYCEDSSLPYHFEESNMEEFVKYLNENNQHKAYILLRNLSLELKKYKNTIINYIKDIYYRFMCELNKNAEKIGISKFTAMTDNNYIWDAFSAFNILDEIVSFSLNILSEYFMYIQDLQKSKNNIVKITNFIEKNYFNVNLSVNDISAHTFLSPAYMCTYFKQETGRTINQYITELRVKKAKELLMNKELRVLDISRMVGYSDGNYFTKIFKKIIGITPNEFRERIN